MNNWAAFISYLIPLFVFIIHMFFITTATNGIILFLTRQLATLEVPSRQKMQPPDRGTYKPEFAPRYSSWPYFSRVFMVSATKNDGIDDLRTFLEERSRHGVWECRPEFVYNQKPKELVQDITRERLLDHLREEVSWSLFEKLWHIFSLRDSRDGYECSLLLWLIIFVDISIGVNDPSWIGWNTWVDFTRVRIELVRRRNTQIM